MWSNVWNTSRAISHRLKKIFYDRAQKTREIQIYLLKVNYLGGYLSYTYLVLMYFKISGIFGKWFSMFWSGEKRKIENFIFCKEHQIPSQILQHFQQSQQLCLLVYLLLVFEKNNLSGSRIHENSNKQRFKSISHLVRNEMNQRFSKTGMTCECFGRNQSF